MSKSKNLLIVGAGYLGTKIAQVAVEKGWNVTAARRSAPASEDKNLYHWINLDVFDQVDVRGTLQSSKIQYSAVVYAVSAGTPDEQAYERAYYQGVKNLLASIEDNVRFIFISSTGVYWEDHGQWVDECSSVDKAKLTPSHQHLAHGEQLVLTKPNSIIARLSGIYGPGRVRLITMSKTLPDQMILEKQIYTNRIHVDDGARAIIHLLDLPTPQSIYCITDNDPAPQHEVLLWIRKKLGLPPPELTFSKDHSVDRRLESLPATNKRISNQRLIESGFKFIYPSFREGYAALIKESGAPG